jgi:hypothetical protein
VARHHLPLHSNHLRLLEGVTAGAPQRPDVVVVPSIRSAEHLGEAHALAAGLGSPLVVLGCPTHALPDQLAVLADWDLAPARPEVVLALPEDFNRAWGEFGCLAMTPTSGQPIDLADKRNTGILLARLLGWRHVLFLDDDVSGLDPRHVKQAVGSLQATRAASWRQRDYPDNSVVCHAHRAVGGTQDVFIGGAFLAVVDDDSPFFPPVYNEDWLFLYPWLVDRQVRYGGDVRQLPYDPFEDPSRAVREEFGDVLAEGLMELLHRRQKLDEAGMAHWTEVIEARAELIDWTEHSLPLANVTDDGRTAMRRSLRAARRELARTTPAQLDGFVRAWLDDGPRWQSALRRLGPVSGRSEAERVRTALDRLGLADHVVLAPW